MDPLASSASRRPSQAQPDESASASLSDRRGFLATAAAAASASTTALVAASSVSHAARLADDSKGPPGDEKVTETPTEVEARLNLVLARFGSHLDSEARASVRGEIEGIVQRAKALRAYRLDNGDGPFPIFSPYRNSADSEVGPTHPH
jgi:hypothetical protein